MYGLCVYTLITVFTLIAGGLRFDVESRRSETEQMLYTIATA